MKALFAEDDIKLGNLVKRFLENEQIQVDWVESGDDALAYAEGGEYDILILDWMMPGKSGIEVCKVLRKNGYQGGVLMLTARDSVEDCVSGLETGADDYLIKPFEFIELRARINSILRRRHYKLQEDLLCVGDLILDKVSHRVLRQQKEILLTKREFSLLEFLMMNQGTTMPREVILDRIWGYDGEVTPNTLDVYVKMLRNKIDDPNQTSIIRNIRGVGYRMDKDV